MDTTQLSDFLAGLVRLSIEGAILVVLVVAAQWAFRRRLSPRWRCALWLLVMARLLLPLSFSSIVSVFNLLPHWPHPRGSTPILESASADVPASPAVITPLPMRNIPAAPAPPPPLQTTQSPSPSWPVWIFAVWLAGVILLAGQVLFSSLRLWKRSAKLLPVTHSATIVALDDCCRQLKVRTRPMLLESFEIKSPVLHGLLRPRLLLPKGFIDQFSLVELRFVFLHELAHLKRRDLLANWVIAALQIIHWFNPLVWFGFGRWRADREVACDAMALETAGPEQNKLYGQTILRLLENFSRPVSTPGLVGILEDKRQLRRRIKMIADYAPARKWPVLALLLATGLAAIGLTDAQSQSSNDHAADTVAILVTNGVPGGATNRSAQSGIVRYRTGGHRQAEDMAQSYTNSLQLRGILRVLKEQKALDCWDVVAKTMPAGLILETMNFSGGTNLGLSGTTPSDQMSAISDFYDKLLTSEKNGQLLFQTSAEGAPRTQLAPGSSTVRWSFDLDLTEGAPKVSETVDPQESAPAAPASSDIARELIGAWILVGTPGNIGPVPNKGGRIKFYTGKYYCMTASDPKNGVVNYHHGGTYTVNGNDYTETVQYANPSTMDFIGKTNGHFNISIEGDTMTLIGIDNPWKEVWKKRTGGAGSRSEMAREMTGMWIRVGADLTDSTAGATLKFITPTDWCFTESDAKTGVVTFHHGGTCTFNGDEYVESVKYANPSTMYLLGQDNKFACKLDGDTLTTTGIGNPWNEVWKRAK